METQTQPKSTKQENIDVYKKLQEWSKPRDYVKKDWSPEPTDRQMLIHSIEGHSNNFIGQINERKMKKETFKNISRLVRYDRRADAPSSSLFNRIYNAILPQIYSEKNRRLRDVYMGLTIISLDDNWEDTRNIFYQESRLQDDLLSKSYNRMEWLKQSRGNN